MDAKNQAYKQSGEEDPGQAAPKGRLDSSAAKSDILARRTTGVVTAVAEGECFVFGSNEAGRHGRGAAAQARRFGARYGVGEGPAGRTYAIPTKPADLRQRLSLDRIGRSVETFVAYAASHPDCIFLVTEIGCGLAGYEPADMAPLFAGAVPLSNVFLPASFWRVLGHARADAPLAPRSALR